MRAKVCAIQFHAGPGDDCTHSAGDIAECLFRLEAELKAGLPLDGGFLRQCERFAYVTIEAAEKMRPTGLMLSSTRSPA